MSRYQHGDVYEAFNAFHVQYYQTGLHDGKLVRVRKSHRLCAKDRIHYSTTAKAVQKLTADYMASVNEDVVISEDITVAQFWAHNSHRVRGFLQTALSKVPRAQPLSTISPLLAGALLIGS